MIAIIDGWDDSASYIVDDKAIPDLSPKPKHAYVAQLLL